MKFNPLLLAVAANSVVPLTFAQSATDITVTGTIAPVACMPTWFICKKLPQSRAQ